MLRACTRLHARSASHAGGPWFDPRCAHGFGLWGTARFPQLRPGCARFSGGEEFFPELTSSGVRRAIAALIGLVWGVPLLLLGLLVLLYSADSRTETSLDFGGVRIDADLVGAIALVGSGALICVSLLVLTGRTPLIAHPALEATLQRAGRATRGVTVDRLVGLLLWWPVAAGAAFLVLFLARLPRLIEHVYWDSDAASATVIAETAGHGTVILERFGWFTALWFALITKHFPLHRQLWEVAPYLFALVSVALLTAASLRLGGRWAAAITATAAVATSPFVSYDLVTLNYHTPTWAATVLLAVYCLWLAQQPGRMRVSLALTALLISAFAGATLASDWLFAFVGLVPFALTGVLLVTLPRFRSSGLLVVASAGLAFPAASVTSWAMKVAGVKVFAVPTRFADADELWPNFGRLLKGIVQLANGDYFFDAQLSLRSTLSFVCAFLALMALAAPFALMRRHFRSANGSIPAVVYACFWASCVTFNCASFVFSSEGTHGGYYLVPVLYAAAATVPLILSSSRPRRLLVSVGVAIVAVTSLVNLADTSTSLSRPLPPVASVADQVVRIAQREHALRGYADYWDAASLTWSRKLDVFVAPASQCEISKGKTDLCGFWFNVNTNWYQPRPGRSFVLRDQESDGLRQLPPDTLGPPTATYYLSDAISMYVYPYDVAARFISRPSS